MQTSSGAEVVGDGDVVTKWHRHGSNPRMLATRLQIAAESESLLSPLSPVPEVDGDRLRTRWPRVDVVAPRPNSLPWAQAGRLLAQLHREAPPLRPPPHGWPQRLRRTADTLRTTRNDVVRTALAALSDVVWRAGSPDRPTTLVHGDFHLGQIGRRAATAPWLLIDVDDLGVGDPAWDLARPAGFWAAGLIPDADWTGFLASYVDAGGPAIPQGDPWQVLDPFARAAVVHAAAHHPDDGLLLAACARMG
jgi:aminoglycoside phosphotransferase (APT) family kinase protein